MDQWKLDRIEELKKLDLTPGQQIKEVRRLDLSKAERNEVFGTPGRQANAKRINAQRSKKGLAAKVSNRPERSSGSVRSRRSAKVHRKINAKNFQDALKGESGPVTTRKLTPEEYFEMFGKELPEQS